MTTTSSGTVSLALVAAGVAGPYPLSVARTPDGIDQEVYALLTAYQALRLAMSGATDQAPDITPDRAGFTIALNTARDQIIHAAGIIAGTVIDLVGKIGRAEPSPNTAPKAPSTAPTTTPPSPSRWV